MPNRRSFLKNTFLTSTGMLILPVLSFAEKANNDTADGELEKGFSEPPDAAKPLAFWMWMNGHITAKGITLDLARMKEMGLAGAFIFNTGTGVPKGPVAYGTDAWLALLEHALAEAKRLGLDLFLHNAPGFSSTGGAKVTPELAMQQLVWTESFVESKGLVNVQLPQPRVKLDYYRDVAVVAFPSPPGETITLSDKQVRITVNGKLTAGSSLQHARQGVELVPVGNTPAILQLEFAEPFEARAVTIYRLPLPSLSVYDATFDHAPTFILECSDDGSNYREICTFGMPLLRYLDAPGAQSFPAVNARFFRLVTNQRTTVTDIRLHSAPRLSGWPGKANFTDRLPDSTEQDIDPAFLIDPEKVLDLTDQLQNDGQLHWQPPPGHWTILRFGHTCTGTKTVATPDGAGGLEIDKFNSEAVDAYFDLYWKDLLQQLKPFVAKSWKGLLIDSYEIGKQNWTAAFPAQFRQKNGYALTAWLPALTGRVVQSVTNTEKFLWDFRRTQADLVAENYYGRFKQVCKAHNLQFYAQPNGDGVFDSLQAGQYPDMPMAEFWARYVPGTLNTIKQAVSIGHGYGHQTIAAEAYTGIPETSRWTGYPYAFKSQGDYMFSLGINRFVLHVFVHQPYTTGIPGMSMGAWGSHFDRNQTWSEGAGEWIRYLSRSQFLLQQGLPVADICYFKGEEPTTVIPDVYYVDPPVPKTLAGDVIGPDVLLQKIKIQDHTIVLSHGMQYRLLVLAPLKRMSPAVLQKIKDLVQQGMYLIVSAKPEDTPGHGSETSGSETVKRLAAAVWGDLDGVLVKQRSFGKGKLYWNQPLAEILKEHFIHPDVDVTAENNDAGIHFTHRRLGGTEIYFVCNHRRRAEIIVARFRVKNKLPEIWNPETGERTKASVFEREENHIAVPLELSPAGSLFIIFREDDKNQAFHAVYHNENRLLSSRPFAAPTEKPFEKLANRFTITGWIKPDTPSLHPKGVLIFPPEAEKLYGIGHAACGLSAGQNGVRVYEREKSANHSARLMLTVQQPLEGWTHLALQYLEGRPSLFINGRLAATGEASGKTVHPGLDTPPTDELFSAMFEGSSTRLQLFHEALTEDTIRQQFQKGLPPPALPSALQLTQTLTGKTTVRIWKNGHYRFEGPAGKKTLRINHCWVIPLSNPWQVRFPRSSGAPPIRLDQLISLHQHHRFDIRYFSGTATYQTVFNLPSPITREQRVLLDLGRVEALADVELNGKKLGTLWKEPFRADITTVLRAGQNRLTVRVTNLWANRMIGDAHLPAENTYDANGFLARLPGWYVNNQFKPGPRKTFSVWNNFTKDDPLLPSGLLGPVRLIIGWEKIIG